MILRSYSVKIHFYNTVSFIRSSILRDTQKQHPLLNRQIGGVGTGIDRHQSALIHTADPVADQNDIAIGSDGIQAGILLDHFLKFRIDGKTFLCIEGGNTLCKQVVNICVIATAVVEGARSGYCCTRTATMIYYEI